MKTLCFFGCALALLCGSGRGTASAQSPDQPAPQEPLLSRAPDGTCTITYKYKPQTAPTPADTHDAPARKADLITSVRFEKRGTEYQVITNKASGVQSKIWCRYGIEINKAEGSEKYVRLTQDSPGYINFSKTDFDELSWIGMDNYKGVKDGPGGVRVFVFEVKNVDRRQTGQESTGTGDLGAALEKAGLISAKSDKKQAVSKLLEAQFGNTVSRALIDVTSQLPVEYDDGQIDRTYAFSLAPLSTPQEVLKLFQQTSEQLRKSTVPASPP